MELVKGASQRCSLQPPGQLFTAHAGAYFISSAPHSYWCQDQSKEEEENEFKEDIERKEIDKRVGTKGNVKREEEEWNSLLLLII